jgi:hypothetical protein
MWSFLPEIYGVECREAFSPSWCLAGPTLGTIRESRTSGFRLAVPLSQTLRAGRWDSKQPLLDRVLTFGVVVADDAREA